MCDHSPNREAAMVVIDPGTPERHGRDGVWCDPCLVPLVKALNDGGLPTVASCCGHGKRPGNIALADGRELVLMPDYEAARALDDHFHAVAEGADVRKPVVIMHDEARMAPELVALLHDWDANDEDDNYSKGMAAIDLRAALHRACVACRTGESVGHDRRCPERLDRTTPAEVTDAGALTERVAAWRATSTRLDADADRLGGTNGTKLRTQAAVWRVAAYELDALLLAQRDATRGGQ